MRLRLGVLILLLPLLLTCVQLCWRLSESSSSSSIIGPPNLYSGNHFATITLLHPLSTDKQQSVLFFHVRSMPPLICSMFSLIVPWWHCCSSSLCLSAGKQHNIPSGGVSMYHLIYTHNPCCLPNFLLICCPDASLSDTGHPSMSSIAHCQQNSTVVNRKMT